jgi:hypothetical protein
MNYFSTSFGVQSQLPITGLSVCDVLASPLLEGHGKEEKEFYFKATY